MSGTMSEYHTTNVMRALGMRATETVVIRTSADRPHLKHTVLDLCSVTGNRMDVIRAGILRIVPLLANGEVAPVRT